MPTASAVVGAFLASRLLVFAAGAVGGAAGSRVAGWWTVDPGRLTTHLGSVGNLLAAPAVRWDALAYLGIASHGYAHARLAAFFPLYPFLIAVLGMLIGKIAAGIIVSLGALAVGLTLLHRLTELELGRDAADATVILLGFAPLSFFFSAIYTESLFLALSVGACYAARRGRFRLAVLLAALATVTRVTGVLLVIPLAVMRVRERGRADAGLAWLLLVPAALAGFCAYLGARGEGWLAPLHQQVGTGSARAFGGPVATVASALAAAWHGIGSTAGGTPPVAFSLAGPFSLGFDSVLLLGALILTLVVLGLAVRRLPVAYWTYALVTLLVVLASRTRLQPLDALNRYDLTIFPLWMAVGSWAAQRRATAVLAGLGGILLAFYTFAFTTWAFVA